MRALKCLLIPKVVVLTKTACETFQPVRALLDSCSEINFILEETAKRSWISNLISKKFLVLAKCAQESNHSLMLILIRLNSPHLSQRRTSEYIFRWPIHYFINSSGLICLLVRNSFHNNSPTSKIIVFEQIVSSKFKL